MAFDMDVQNSHLPVGSELGNGKYKILRFIGAGGFGCTYEAEFELMRTRVAIKEFFVGTYCNRAADGNVVVGTNSQVRFVEQLQDKFIREARSLYRLSHPNIVHVSDVLQENGTSYYVMEYIDGRSLQEILAAEGPLSEARALHYVAQMMDALEYVHGQMMLHLDIKPANVMIDKNDNAVLIDFGVSKQYDEVDGHNTSNIMGQTPGYAPLEQTTNTVKQFTPATDIYALGATLYAMLSGETPPPPADLLAGVAYLKPLPQSVNPSTLDAINAMMQPKRDMRPQTIAQARQLLLGSVPPPQSKTATIPVINNVPPQKATPTVRNTPPFTPPLKKKPKRKSKLWVWITLASVICLGIIGASVYYYITNKDSEPSYYWASHQYAEFDDYDTYDDNDPATEVAVEEVAAPEYYDALSGSEYGYDWVDMGTSVNWATSNVPGYYAWAETSTKDVYDERTSLSYGNNMGAIAGLSSFDCAQANWGGNWRMPTKDECQELIDYCDWTWTGTGMRVTASNGNTLFFPAAGFFGSIGDPIDNGKSGYYWTATPYDNENSWSLTFDANGPRMSCSDDARYWGMCIRPVIDK